MNTPEHLEQAKACFFEGNTLFEAGRLEEAADRYQSALALVPGRPSILANLGVTQCRLGRWPEAVATLTQATKADPGHRDAWVALGLLMLSTVRGSPELFAFDNGVGREQRWTPTRPCAPGPRPRWQPRPRCNCRAWPSTTARARRR